MEEQNKQRNNFISVAMITSFFWPVYGGTESATFNLAKELSGRCKVTVHTFNCTSEENFPPFRFYLEKLASEEFIDNIHVFRYPFIYLPIAKFFSPGLLRNVLKSKTDIIHIQGFRTLFNNFLLRAFARKKVFVLTTHGLHEGVEIIKKYPFSKLLRRIIVHWYLNSFNLVIALSKADESLLRLLGCKTKIAVIPNGIDEAKFCQREDFIERDKRHKILSVARFSPNKGHEDLLKALGMIRDEVDFIAYLVGTITDKAYFEQVKSLVADMKLQNYVKFGISISNPQLIDCYLSSEIFVLPSRMETLPLVLLEAMYAGLPIVATKVGGIPDVVKNGINGYVVDPGSPAQLAEKLLILLRDDDLRTQIGERNRTESKRYMWRYIAEQTMHLYEREAATRKRKTSY